MAELVKENYYLQCTAALDSTDTHTPSHYSLFDSTEIRVSTGHGFEQ